MRERSKPACAGFLFSGTCGGKTCPLKPLQIKHYSEAAEGANVWHGQSPSGTSATAAAGRAARKIFSNFCAKTFAIEFL